MNSTLTKNQKKTYGPKVYTEGGQTYRITANLRFDDECGNGHNTFSMTGTIDREGRNGQWYDHSGGCIHEKIIKHFPELAKYVKWHLTSTDGPMHYIANTVYLAGDKDCNGLRAGEKRQIKNGRTGLPVWERVVRDMDGFEVKMSSSEWVDSETRPDDSGLTVSWEPVWRVGNGKERELNSARSSAVWDDATDEELTAPGLEERLMARLPALMAEFKADMKSLGFVY